MQKTDYIVTETAPPRVAGRLVLPGDTVQLTDDEARLEVLNGSIRLPDEAAPVAAQPPAQPEASDDQRTAGSKGRKK